MRGRYLTIAAITLLLLFSLRAVVRWRSHSLRVAAEHEWIQEAVEAVAHVPPPPIAPGQSGEGPWWAPPGYLRFSNGWAAYKTNTIHDRPKVGDTTVLQNSDGALFLSRTHFCTGIPELMWPDPYSGDLGPRPADATDFLEHW